MKVALCLSGQPKLYDKGYPFLKKYLIDEYNIEDVFVHFWWNDKTGSIGTPPPWQPGVGDEIIQNKNHYSNIQELYNPVLMTYDTPMVNQIKVTDKERELKPEGGGQACELWFNHSKRTREYLYNHYRSMFKSQYIVNQLKREHERQQGFKYDLVVRTRFDIELHPTKMTKDVMVPEEGWKTKGGFAPSIQQMKDCETEKDAWSRVLSEKVYTIYDNLFIYKSTTHDEIMDELWDNFDEIFYDQLEEFGKRTHNGVAVGTPEDIQEIVISERLKKHLHGLPGDSLEIIRL